MSHEGVALGGVILMYPVILKTGKGSLAPPSSSFDEKKAWKSLATIIAPPKTLGRKNWKKTTVDFDFFSK